MLDPERNISIPHALTHKSITLPFKKINFQRDRLLSNNLESYRVGLNYETIEERTPCGKSIYETKPPSYYNSRYGSNKTKTKKKISEEEIKNLRSKHKCINSHSG